MIAASTTSSPSRVKARAVCPSCLGRRMNEGALNLVDHVLPDVPLRQFVLTLPFALRFPLAFDGKLLGQVVRIFTDTVAGWYRQRHIERGLPTGESGALTVIQACQQRPATEPALSHRLPGRCLLARWRREGQMFHPAPTPAQQESRGSRPTHQQARSPLPPASWVSSPSSPAPGEGESHRRD